MGQASVVVAQVTDENLVRAIDTVAYFDQQKGVGKGLLVMWLRNGDFQSPMPVKDKSSFWGAGWDALVAEMRREGFSEREAPLAAQSVLIRPNQPRGELLRAHLRGSYGWLYDGEDTA